MSRGDCVACPFKVGELVIYKPTVRGRGLGIMTDLAKLQPGEKYKVVEIVNNDYLVVEGFEKSVGGGGLYWTEFVSADADENKPTS